MTAAMHHDKPFSDGPAKRCAARLRALIPIALLSAALGSAAQPQADGDAAAAANAVQDFHRALASGNADGAARLLAADAVILENGKAETRAEYLAHHLQSDIEFAAAVPSRRGKLDVKVLGDLAWAASTSVMQGSFRSKPVSLRSAELMLLSRTASGWEIRAIHWSSGKGP